MSIGRKSTPLKKSTRAQPAASADDEDPVPAPARASFEEFLLNDARVPTGCGLYGPYSFAGREALLVVVRVIDRVLGSATLPSRDSILSDAEVSIAGGAQFGKTILELNLAAYLTSQQFRNFGLYLPDDDLVEGIVDAKFRPEVVDQIGWFADMVQVGKALNKSGKAVNRKGAFLVTDGERKSMGLIRGLGKVPTTFSLDAAALDEVDDIQPRMLKFVRGRLTASDLRFLLQIGTQRVHGRGMNRAWKAGSQGVFLLQCPACGRRHNPEEEFPQIVRLRSERGLSQAAARGLATGTRTSEGPPAGEALRVETTRAPRLTWAGDFKIDGDNQATFAHNPFNQYYLGCVACGAELDRTRPIEEHRRPALIQQRKWSFRISQLAIAAIDLSQIVARFQLAAADPEEMTVFRCDVLGLPQSTSQALTPAVLERARSVEAFDLPPRCREGNVAYGGLDMGDRCWLFARELCSVRPVARFGGLPMAGSDQAAGSPLHCRLLAAQQIPAADVVAHAQAAFHRLGLSALFIDERPLVNEARTLALALNGLQSVTDWPPIAHEKEACVTFPGGLTWDGRNARWHNLKCAVVRFTKTRLGAGIEHTMVFFEECGQTKFVPCIACNRFETIDRAVREFLTPREGVMEVLAGRLRETPALLLPRRTADHPAILDTVESHHITGSERAKETDGTLGDYVDGCENHFLLANGYSALAAAVCQGGPRRKGAAPILLFENTRQSHAVQERRDRSVQG